MLKSVLTRARAALKWLSVERNRAILYRTLTALGTLGVVAGIVSEEQVTTILSATAQVLGVLGNGLASANTSTKKES